MHSAPFPPSSIHEGHLWRVELDPPTAALDDLAACLSAEERQRADRFVRESDRRRFTVSHAALRNILGRCLDIAPEKVAFTTTPGGKPELAPQFHSSEVRFNLSHSHELALAAVTLGGEVGVDLEHVRPICELKNIVGRYFTCQEQAQWHAMAEQERLPAFFRCWTRKEAYLKARGVGLSGGLDRFEVTLAPDQPARLVRDLDRPDATERWRLYDLSPCEGYMAACAVERGAEKISVFDWKSLRGCGRPQ